MINVEKIINRYLAAAFINEVARMCQRKLCTSLIHTLNHRTMIFELCVYELKGRRYRRQYGRGMVSGSVELSSGGGLTGER
jgi:hypothetical protein